MPNLRRKQTKPNFALWPKIQTKWIAITYEVEPPLISPVHEKNSHQY